jgi:hypothetical protein
MLRRVFKVKIPPSAYSDLDRFLERVSGALHSYGAVIRIEDDTLIIEVYGGRSMIRDSWIRIKRILSEYLTPPKGGYSLKRIYRDVGLALPPDTLVEAVKSQGYRASIDGEFIHTNAPYEDVLEAAYSIKRALEDVKSLPATRTAKKLLITLSAIWGQPASRIAELLLSRGYARLTEEGKLELIKPWKELLRELRGRRP